jgi:putative membrane protein insertion efficiency factor
MGHRDSPTEFGRYREFLVDNRRAAEVDPAHDRCGSPEGLNRGPGFALRWMLLAFLETYKVFLSPFFGGACKYHPSCSNYAYQAIERHGARRGVVLALKRLGRCRPFRAGGFDPVPTEAELNADRLRAGEAEPLR